MVPQNTPSDAKKAVKHVLRDRLEGPTEENLSPSDLQIEKTNKKDLDDINSASVVDIKILWERTNPKGVRNIVEKELSQKFGGQCISTHNESNGTTVRIDWKKRDTPGRKRL